MNHSPWVQGHSFWQRSIIILLLQRNGPERREETARVGPGQLRAEHRKRGQPFASGFFLGAIAAAGVVRWLIESQSRKAARQHQDVFSWPTIVKTRRR